MLREHRMNEVNRLHASATGERQRTGELMNRLLEEAKDIDGNQ